MRRTIWVLAAAAAALLYLSQRRSSTDQPQALQVDTSKRKVPPRPPAHSTELQRAIATALAIRGIGIER